MIIFLNPFFIFKWEIRICKNVYTHSKYIGKFSFVSILIVKLNAHKFYVIRDYLFVFEGCLGVYGLFFSNFVTSTGLFCKFVVRLAVLKLNIETHPNQMIAIQYISFFLKWHNLLRFEKIKTKNTRSCQITKLTFQLFLRISLSNKFI